MRRRRVKMTAAEWDTHSKKYRRLVKNSRRKMLNTRWVKTFTSRRERRTEARDVRDDIEHLDDLRQYQRANGVLVHYHPGFD